MRRMPYLYQILADGTIADNRRYGYRSDALVSPPRPPIALQGSGYGPKNTGRVFDFLRAAAGLTGMEQSDANVVIIRPDGYEHNTSDPFITLQGYGAGDFGLATGNLVGTVRLARWPDYRLTVSSRFGAEFLKYIVADADGFAELPELGARGAGDIHWLLPYMWAVKMKRAWRLGLPKEYVTRSETGARVRGQIDPLSQLTGAALARYRCTYREHSQDHPVTRLLARVLEQVDVSAFLPEAAEIRRTLQAATGGVRHPLPELLAAAPVRNPYFSDYNPLAALSKLLLRGHALDTAGERQDNALLFDVSMLFEYFVRKLLQRSGIVLLGKSSLALSVPTGLANGRRRQLIPDIVFEASGRYHVFEVKYKSFDFGAGAAREDLFQLHTYVSQVMALGPVCHCGFIYPVRASVWERHDLQRHDGIVSQPVQHGGHTLQFHAIFLKVPESGDFRAAFASACRDAVAALQRRIGI
jgi:hypothetical protein